MSSHPEDRHALYDFESDAIGYGELWAHLTDDHDWPTAQVAAMSYNERERTHKREHASD